MSTNDWTHRERALLNQLKRAREERDALAEALADERLLRRAAWKTCWEAMQSKMFSVISMLAMAGNVALAANEFESRVHANLRRMKRVG